MSKLSYLHTIPSVPNSYSTFNDVIKRNAETLSNTEAFIYRSGDGHRQCITFSDLYEKGSCVAQYLVTSGVQRQDKVGLFGPNTIPRIVAEFGILLAGAVVLHLNIDVKNSKDCADVLEKAKCRIIFADPGVHDDFLPTIRSLENRADATDNRRQLIFLRKPCSTSINHTLINDIQIAYDSSIVLPEVCPEDDAVIFTTSGSTGKPKMVVHGHFAFTVSTESISDTKFKETKYFNNRPLGWLGGSQAYATVRGITQVFTDSNLGITRNGIKTIWKIMTEENVKVAMFMPYCLFDLIAEQDNIKDDGFRLESIVTGGQIVDGLCTQVIGRFCKTLAVTYGSTETMIISTVLSNSADFKIGDVGKLSPGVEARIVDENGRVVPIGEEGEIQIRSRFSMKRYHTDETMTNKAYTKDRPSWFRIEDIGLITPAGHLIVRGRVKENISRGGRKVLPGVVDDVVKQMEGISLVATVAVPDERLYEEVCVCYVAKDGVDLSPSDVQQYCTDNFSKVESADGMGSMPTYFVRFDNFPVFYMGKIDKPTLKRQAADSLNLSAC
ncbi:medium-chain acyl-CoA ligase ACSF2, mitochondrial-like [Pecten maximus]|uniref:medium-chain acyl-CoA ligase ACSF2, mitochondrial-like n=1 Tax=Pecten maximus TaxID=6579 RepID=UPI001458BBB0|nr:medium-chain acyl-CoA ligase ACSF2, mitochondrial-like [Pecten maximus]XP_033728862.1 medium-chain acyl-CoA ligase ACSF2, mitochondrial-like [Pecten maximus]